MIAEESFIDFECPYCGEPVSFPQDYVGSAQACPSCTEALIVPKPGSGTGGKLPFPLTTPRLVLRRLRLGDWKDLLELLSDEELFQYTDGRTMEEQEILHWLESDSCVKLTTPNQVFCLGLEVQDGGKLIGYLTLNFFDPQRLQAGLNIYVNRGYQRQGIATEAVAAMLDFCFAGISLHRVAASCGSRNVAACGLLEKAGLRREGVFRKDSWIRGEWVDTVYYALLGEEHRAAGSQPATEGAV